MTKPGLMPGFDLNAGLTLYSVTRSLHSQFYRLPAFPSRNMTRSQRRSTLVPIYMTLPSPKVTVCVRRNRCCTTFCSVPDSPRTFSSQDSNLAYNLQWTRPYSMRGFLSNQMEPNIPGHSSEVSVVGVESLPENNTEPLIRQHSTFPCPLRKYHVQEIRARLLYLSKM